MTLTALQSAEQRTAASVGVPATIVFADDSSRYTGRAIAHAGMREEREGGFVQKRTLTFIIPASKIASTAIIESTTGRIRTRTFTHSESGFIYNLDSEHPLGGVVLSPSGQYYTLRASQVVP